MLNKLPRANYFGLIIWVLFLWCAWNPHMAKAVSYQIWMKKDISSLCQCQPIVYDIITVKQIITFNKKLFCSTLWNSFKRHK
jgi:hypothetical protein